MSKSFTNEDARVMGKALYLLKQIPTDIIPEKYTWSTQEYCDCIEDLKKCLTAHDKNIFGEKILK
jgi:hypothetical protein